MSKLRIVGQLNRLAHRQLTGVTTRLVPIASMQSPIIKRQWHHQADMHANQQKVSNTIGTTNEEYSPLAELDHQLNEIKVFQDEQIIQLEFKSGQSVNYTMTWMRNLCSCPECLNAKLRLKPTLSEPKSSFVEGKLSVVRTRCISENELEIEWLDTQYKRHVSSYNLKYLNIYATH